MVLDKGIIFLLLDSKHSFTSEEHTISIFQGFACRNTYKDSQEQRRISVSLQCISHIQSLSQARLFATPRTVCSPPGSSVCEISQQEYWSRLLFPPPGDLPYPGIKPMNPVFPTLAGGFFTTEPHVKPHQLYRNIRDQKNVTLHMEENSCLTHPYTSHLRQPVFKVW